MSDPGFDARHMIPANDPRSTIPQTNDLLHGVGDRLDSIEKRLGDAESTSRTMLNVSKWTLVAAVAAAVVSALSLFF